MKKLSIFAVLLNSLAFAGTFSISPTPQFVVPGQKITFTTTASGNTYTWSISTNPGSAVSSSGSTVDYTVPSLDPCTQITITATKAGSGGASEETESLTLVVAAPGATAPLEPCAGGNVSFGIIGLEQSGGASVKSTQRLFIDILTAARSRLDRRIRAQAVCLGPPRAGGEQSASPVIRSRSPRL